MQEKHEFFYIEKNERKRKSYLAIRYILTIIIIIV